MHSAATKQATELVIQALLTAHPEAANMKDKVRSLHPAHPLFSCFDHT